MPPRRRRVSVPLVCAWLAMSLLPGAIVAAEPAKPVGHAAEKRADGDPPLRPRRPDIPPVGKVGEHPIDRLLEVYFAAHKLDWPAPADDATFVRRVHLDLIGLLPAADEAQAFAADSPADKRARAIDELLRDRRAVADHWLSFWNDLLRNDYVGVGYTDGGRKQLTPWLYSALVNNMPFDQFVRELISPTADSEAFVFGIKWRGKQNASQTPEIQFSQNVSQVFFGINMKCASCHDSFIDHWKLDDAYALAAIVSREPLEVFRCDKATGHTAQMRFLWPELGTVDPEAARDERLKQLAALVTHAENGRFARTIVNRVWQRLMGRGLVEPVDVMANPAWNQDLLDYLATYLVDQKYDLEQLVRHITNSRIYQAQAQILPSEPDSEFVFHGPAVKRMTAEQFVDAIWVLTDAAPKKANAAVKLPDAARAERQFIRSSLVRSDLLMRSLGRPNREQVVTTRGQQLTTLQALDLSNGEILHGTLLKGVAPLRRQHAELPALVDSVWRRALARAPTADERAVALELLGQEPTDADVADLLWTVVMLPEFQLIR
ncbi:MAG: DUF1549 domain-containing protein [Planctomycetes bacterium]|nr:DUF1549 domain-containing protein [Planctomycetota bacterium]